MKVLIVFCAAFFLSACSTPRILMQDCKKIGENPKNKKSIDSCEQVEVQ